MLKARLLGAVGIVAVVGGIVGVTAQTPVSPKFEVASVRVAVRAMGSVSPVSPFGRSRWSVGCIPLDVLLSLAFDVTPFDIAPVVGLPGWNRTECYSIAAKAEDGVLLTREELRPRLKQLLEERFHLVAHTQITEVRGYALVLAKGGPKLKDRMPSGGIAGTLSVNLFVKQLAQVIHQPVIDETGLVGYYDLSLKYALEGATDSALPSIFTALQEQLGLKLEGGRKVPVNTLVIDHVEHPTED